MYFLGLYLGKSLPLIVYAGNFVPWGLFFVLGMFFAKNNSSIPLSKIVMGIVFFCRGFFRGKYVSYGKDIFFKWGGTKGICVLPKCFCAFWRFIRNHKKYCRYLKKRVYI